MTDQNNRFFTGFDISSIVASDEEIEEAKRKGEYFCGIDYGDPGTETAVEAYFHEGKLYITDMNVMTYES